VPQNLVVDGEHTLELGDRFGLGHHFEDGIAAVLLVTDLVRQPATTHTSTLPTRPPLSPRRAPIRSMAERTLSASRPGWKMTMSS